MSSPASAARFPRVAFEARRPVPPAEPLRTDVAGAIVRCARGPVSARFTEQREDQPLRVEGWRQFEAVFGGLEGDSLSSHAVKGYFESGGEVLWVVRVARNPRTATVTMPLPPAATGLLGSWPPEQPQIWAAAFEVSGTSPGRWTEGLRVQLRLRIGGTPAGRRLADLRVVRGGETVEHLLALEPAHLVEEVARLSAFVRFRVSSPASRNQNPTVRDFSIWASLGPGADDPPTLVEYDRAARALAEEPEPAILFAPDAWTDLRRPDPTLTWDERHEDVHRFYRSWGDAAARAMDRSVLVDPPVGATGQRLLETATHLRQGPSEEALHPLIPAALALYYPHLLVPLGGPAMRPSTRVVPPSGHVAGVISRLDRERGAQHTPANAEVVGAVDLDRDYDDAERAVLNRDGVNALRCARGRGVEVWGGRTLHPDPHRRFLAHRRLIHRLVRAMRRVAEPLVFDSNTPTLRFALVRAITSVLLEAFRGGGLKGARPEEAFQVVCDDRTNPPDAFDTGHCTAEVSLAPAVPMEFIHLTVSLSQDGSLEVLE